MPILEEWRRISWYLINYETFFGFCINLFEFEIQILPRKWNTFWFMPTIVVKNSTCIFVNKYIRQFKLLLQMNRQNYLQQRNDLDRILYHYSDQNISSLILKGFHSLFCFHLITGGGPSWLHLFDGFALRNYFLEFQTF